MKKLLIFILVTAQFALFGVYQVGDIVENHTFMDSNGGDPVERSIYGLIDEGKILSLNFGAIGCEACIEEQPQLEAIWQEYEASNPGKLHMLTYVAGCMSWDDINGSQWRRFQPPSAPQLNLTFYLSIHDQFWPVYSDYVPTANPWNVVIGPEYKVYYAHGFPDEYDDAALREVLEDLIGVGIEDENVVSDVTLHQNYPNPFNPETTISFTLAENANVELAVFNAEGAKVSDVVKSNLVKGVHSYNFDGKNLNSGIYFYKLDVNGISTIKKMTLVK